MSFRWGDLDGEKCRLSVRPEIAKGKRARIVPLPVSLVDELSVLRTVHYRCTGRAPGTSSPIFLTPHGKHWSKGRAANARKALSRLLEEAEIPEEDETGRSIDIHAPEAALTSVPDIASGKSDGLGTGTTLGTGH